MPLRKHGTPESAQPDEDRVQKQATPNFTEEDREALRKENAAADRPDDEE